MSPPEISSIEVSVPTGEMSVLCKTPEISKAALTLLMEAFCRPNGQLLFACVWSLLPLSLSELIVFVY